jgi:hypothetical protein
LRYTAQKQYRRRSDFKSCNLVKRKTATAKIGEIRLFFTEKVACDPKNIIYDRAVFVLIQKLRKHRHHGAAVYRVLQI